MPNSIINYQHNGKVYSQILNSDFTSFNFTSCVLMVWSAFKGPLLGALLNDAFCGRAPGTMLRLFSGLLCLRLSSLDACSRVCNHCFSSDGSPTVSCTDGTSGCAIWTVSCWLTCESVQRTSQPGRTIVFKLASEFWVSYMWRRSLWITHQYFDHGPEPNWTSTYPEWTGVLVVGSPTWLAKCESFNFPLLRLFTDDFSWCLCITQTGKGCTCV